MVTTKVTTTEEAALSNAFADFGQRDFSRMNQLFAPDVTWYTPVLGTYCTYTGLAAVADYLNSVLQKTGHTLRLEAVTMCQIDAPDGAVVFVPVNFSVPRPNNTRFTVRVIQEFQFTRAAGGKIQAVYEYVSDPTGLAGLWAPTTGS